MSELASAAVESPAEAAPPHEDPGPARSPVETPARAPAPEPRRQPRYRVVLWNDDDHTYDYVVAMLQKLCGFPKERGYRIAVEVDRTGRAVVLTTTREHAEFKRDQIHAYGADRLLARSQGSMKASIEPDA